MEPSQWRMELMKRKLDDELNEKLYKLNYLLINPFNEMINLLDKLQENIYEELMG